MNRYYWTTKSCPHLSTFVEAETAGKAKYKLWLSGGNDLYKDFKDFLKDIKIFKVNSANEVK